MLKSGSAYTMNLIKVEASPRDPGEVFISFSDKTRHLFGATLEICSVGMLARACAESLTASDWDHVWIEAPNPNAAADLLHGIRLDKAGMLRQVEEARAKLDAIEAAILAREDIEAIEEKEQGEQSRMVDLQDRIKALSLPQLERLLAALQEVDASQAAV